VLSRLDSDISALQAAEVALIVSELVTNSVLHAHVADNQALFLELTPRGDYLRIAVIDPGADDDEPHIRPEDPAKPGGFGLRLVDQLSSAWGVIHDATGMTRVWCDLWLDHAL
jgi:anti-sigma regulatory factor (Ser/Thr protein kinase)